MDQSILGRLDAAVRELGGGRRVGLLSGGLAVVLLIWERWFHVEALGLNGEEATSWFAVVRDVLAVWILAAVAIVASHLVVSTVRSKRSSRGVLSLRRGVITAAIFGFLLAIAIGVEEVLFGDAAVSAAPGAGYLSPDSGILASLSHGFRDALVAQLVIVPFALISAIWLQRSMTPTESVAPAQAIPAQMSTSPAGVSRARQKPRRVHSRREALQYGTAGTFVMALGSGGLVAATTSTAHAAEAPEVTPWLSRGISLFINDGIKKMIDGTPVYMWGWGFESEGVDDRLALHTPGPVIWTHEGEQVELRITNTLNEDHSFAVDGVVDSGVISPGETKVVTFAAPSAGTYLYQDALNSPVNRVLGLHGTLIVMPADRSMRSRSDLAAEYWTFDTQWVWMFNQIDPSFNSLAQADRPIDAAAMRRDFKPRYFTINGRQGSLAAHPETAPDTVIEDKLDHPALVRIINAGISMHSPHIHGNHVYVLAEDDRLAEPIMWKDTLLIKPEERRDCYLPFNIPPNAVRWPPHPDGAAFLRELHGTDMEGKFPMHCHTEQSQTAAGGLYPQGLVTDWKIK
jgi:FtsP/CotA-like multicopper oxidase with cupredoxin domain